MDQRVVEQKLESLRKCITRVEAKTPPSPEDLESNIDLQDIISVNLERAVQLCVDIGTHIIASSQENAPNTMGGTFDLLVKIQVLDNKTALTMKRAVGFRNIAVHNYQKIDWDIVYSICTKQLDDFKQFAREISRNISKS